MEKQKMQISSSSFFLSTLSLYFFSINALMDIKFMDYELMHVKFNTHLWVFLPKQEEQYVFKELRKKYSFSHGRVLNFR